MSEVKGMVRKEKTLAPEHQEYARGEENGEGGERGEAEAKKERLGDEGRKKKKKRKRRGKGREKAT